MTTTNKRHVPRQTRGLLQPAGAIRIGGLVSSPGEVAIADLAAMPHQTVVTFDPEIDDAAISAYAGPLLFEVLALAGMEVDEAQLGAAHVLVTGADGYQSVVALAEVAPMGEQKRVILALTRDGAPLAEGYGPAWVMLHGDNTLARCTYAVASIELLVP